MMKPGSNNTKASTRSRKRIAGAGKSDQDQPQDRSALAAYLIGYDCTVIRLLQVLRWECLIALPANEVTNTLDEIRTQLKQLPEISPEMESEFSRLRGKFTRASNTIPPQLSESDFHTRQFLEKNSPGSSAWLGLVEFADSLFPESKTHSGWRALGKNLAQFQVHLQFLGDRAILGKNPSLRPFVESAERLKEEGLQGTPKIVQQLASYSGRLGELSIQRILANLVDTPEEQLASDTGSFRERQSVLRQTFNLHSLICSSLLSATATGAKELRVLDDIQIDILKALDGAALKKEALARKIRRDPSQFYHYERLKALRGWGLVSHLPRVGFFRPDALPAEMDPTTYSKSKD